MQLNLSHLESGSLFAAAGRGSLKHPTHSLFSAQGWVDAFEKCYPATTRDNEILLAAIYFGGELEGLRTKIKSSLGQLSQDDALTLVLAVANQQFIIIQDRTRAKLRNIILKSDVSTLGRSDLLEITNQAGQQLSPDTAIANIVDSLPHLLFHATQRKSSDVGTDRSQTIENAPLLTVLGSIEYALRIFWQQVLWEGYSVNEIDGFRGIQPTNDKMAAHWLAWQNRFETLIQQKDNVNTAKNILNDDRSFIPPILKRSVMSFENGRGKKHRYLIGKAPKDDGRQTSMINQLESTYIRHLLDVVAPKYDNIGLTYRQLLRAWWVLNDVATAHRRLINKAQIKNWANIDGLSLRISIKRLRTALQDALSIKGELADAMIDVFSICPTNTSEMFTKGAWGRPIIRSGKDDKARLIMATLFFPNPILMMERWFDVTDFTDGKSGQRGTIFECDVREQVKKSGNSNSLLTNFLVNSLPYTGKGSEEIDILICFGKTIIVGEAKCFNIPFEPNDRYNHLKKIEVATAQAKRKADWLRSKLDTMLPKLGLEIGTNSSDLTVQPLVILNNSFGVGLAHCGCPVTDIDWLSRIFGNPKVAIGGEFERRGEMRLERETVYLDCPDLEARFAEIAANPSALNAELRRIDWKTSEFPHSSGSKFLLRHAISKASPN